MSNTLSLTTIAWSVELSLHEQGIDVEECYAPLEMVNAALDTLNVTDPEIRENIVARYCNLEDLQDE